MPNYANNMLGTTNNAGGEVFALNVWKRLDRFLILGADGSTYYQSAKALTRENAAVVTEAWGTDPVKTADMIVQASASGRAPKNDPAIFAIALGVIHPDEIVRSYAYATVYTVCRTATHLFMFVNFARTLGKGWGRGMKRTVANWYDSKNVDDLAYQVIKYRSRYDYDHSRLLHTAHPQNDTNGLLYKWIVADEKTDDEGLPPIVSHFMAAQNDTLAIEQYYSLPWEAFPTSKLNDPKLWEVLLPNMPINAMVRNLGKMTSIGVLSSLNENTSIILTKLRDSGLIRRSRMHPLQFLTAMKVYAQGHGEKGSLSWTPVQNIIRALNDAFYMAFGNVEVTGERYLLALDVSSSMKQQAIAGSLFNSREGAAALALVTATMEPKTQIVGFSRTSTALRYNSDNMIVPLNIGAGQRLDDVIKIMEDVPFGGTDCSLPMKYAIANKLEVDKFVIFTDNETYAGKRLPYLALQEYRKVSGINAKLIVVGMTSTGFSIADPRDTGMLDVVGFDTAVPNLISGF